MLWTMRYIDPNSTTLNGGIFKPFSLWSSSCMSRKGCHHSLLPPLWFAYFWLLFSSNLVLVWVTDLALGLIKPCVTALAQRIQRALAHCTAQLFPPTSHLFVFKSLHSYWFQPSQVSTLSHLFKSFKTSFSVLSSSCFFLLTPTQMNNKWTIMGIALSDEQLRFVSQMP